MTDMLVLNTLSVVEADAREFGLHVHSGGWQLGLLVARNVAVNFGSGGFRDRRDPRTRDTHDDQGKVSATRFAVLADTSPARVLRHLRAWDRAAMRGHVRASADLSPGSEVQLDAEHLPDWAIFYRTKASVPTQLPSPGDDDSLLPVDATDQQRWAKAIELAGQGVSFRQIALLMDIGRRRVEGHPEVRAARLKANPDAQTWRNRYRPAPVVTESQRNYEYTLACNIEPAPEAIREIEALLRRMLGKVYTLSQADQRKLDAVLTAAQQQLETYGT